MFEISERRLQEIAELDKEFVERMGFEYPLQIQTEYAGEIDENKILVVADLHEKYAHDVMLRRMKDMHHDAGTVVVDGDLGDFYSKSRFRKRKYVSFEDECRAVFARMAWFQKYWRKTYIVLGNHDDRPEKKIADILGGAGEADLLELTERNLLKRMSLFFPNIEVVGTTLYTHEGQDIHMSHVWQYKDIVFTHSEISRKQPTATMELISNWLLRWRDVVGLRPFRVIVQAHNHFALKTQMGNELWIMTPCAAYTKSEGFEYVFSPRMVGHPPVVGYTVIRNKEGKTDFNETNFYVHQDG
jgi:hypothetical protein